VLGDSELMCGAPEFGDGDGEGLGELGLFGVGLLESFEHAVVSASPITNALTGSKFLYDSGIACSFPPAEAASEQLCKMPTKHSTVGQTPDPLSATIHNRGCLSPN